MSYEITEYNELLNSSNESIKELITVEYYLLKEQLKESVVLKNIFFFKTLTGFLGYYKHIINGVTKLIALACIDKNNIMVATDLAVHVAYMKYEILLFDGISNDKNIQIDLLLKQFYLFDQTITVKEFLLKNGIKLVNFFLFVAI